jgi:tetratricopeptide (TPR) repeat protein
MKRLGICATLLVVTTIAGSSVLAGSSQKKKTPIPKPQLPAVSEKRQTTADLEAYLTKHPEDESKREEALRTYSRYSVNLERLKYHTFQMINHHPSNNYIVWQNSTSFYMDRQFALDVVSRLEGQVTARNAVRDIYWMIADICARVAVPPTFDDAASREHFLSYYGLPKDTRFPSEADKALVEKSIRYYRLAIEAAANDSFHTALYSQQLGSLLDKLHRTDEAITVIKAVLPARDGTTRTSLLVTYGDCLKKVGKTEEAKLTLKEVRANDHEGFGDGPGCDTTKAENTLGMIALEEGKTAEACRYLLSSCNVQRCCHSITWGLPLKLAKRLLEKGQYDCVIRYCRTVLSEFASGEKETESVLQQALSAKKASVRK